MDPSLDVFQEMADEAELSLLVMCPGWPCFSNLVASMQEAVIKISRDSLLSRRARRTACADDSLYY